MKMFESNGWIFFFFPKKEINFVSEISTPPPTWPLNIEIVAANIYITYRRKNRNFRLTLFESAIMFNGLWKSGFRIKSQFSRYARNCNLRRWMNERFEVAKTKLKFLFFFSFERIVFSLCIFPKRIFLHRNKCFKINSILKYCSSFQKKLFKFIILKNILLGDAMWK